MLLASPPSLRCGRPALCDPLVSSKTCFQEKISKPFDNALWWKEWWWWRLDAESPHANTIVGGGLSSALRTEMRSPIWIQWLTGTSDRSSSPACFLVPMRSEGTRGLRGVGSEHVDSNLAWILHAWRGGRRLILGWTWWPSLFLLSCLFWVCVFCSWTCV